MMVFRRRSIFVDFGRMVRISIEGSEGRVF